MKFSFLVVFTVFAFVAQGQNMMHTSSSKKLRVVLDPGHGGRDSATKANGIYEKDLVLTIANEVKQQLLLNGFEVSMTRETDEFISLTERTLLNGDLFISLHANTVPDTIGPSVRSMIKGLEIYTDHVMNFDAGLPEKSALLASKLAAEFSKLKGIKLRGVKQKPLAVLRNNRFPAVLIELGFLSNEEDVAFLRDGANHKLIAKAVVDALQAYGKQLVATRQF
jgi:N-acetylmuramoyl-L-alanine amidase